MQITIWLALEIESFSFNQSHQTLLQEALPDVEICACYNPEEFIQALPQTDIAIVWFFKQEWLDLAPRLKWIATPAAGRDFFHISAPDHVHLSYGTFHGQIMAESVLAMMLAHCRGILSAVQYQDKAWPRLELSQKMHTLRGKHLVILGLGNIGQWIAWLAKPFGMKITGIKQTRVEKPAFFSLHDQVTTIDHLDEILPTTDYLVLCLPRSPKTDHLINERRLALLKSSAYLYNVGRGNAIDETALKQALKQRQIAGAILDVFETEPLSNDSPLLDCPRLLRMPHVSAVDPGYLELFIEQFLKEYQSIYHY